MQAHGSKAVLLIILITLSAPTLVVPPSPLPAAVSTTPAVTPLPTASSGEPDEFDAFQFNEEDKPQPLSAWQVMLMGWGGSLLFTTFTIYDYCVHKVAAVRRYISRTISSPRS